MTTLEHPRDPSRSTKATIDIDINDRFKLGNRNEITWGAGYRAYLTSSNGGGPVAFFPNSQLRNLYNIFLQDNIALKPDRLFLTLGSKLEHNDFTGLQLEPSARLLWTPDKQNSVWASVSRATQTPSLANTGSSRDTCSFCGAQRCWWICARRGDCFGEP